MACDSEHGLISVNDALAQIASTVQTLAIESIPIQNSLSRYLAQDVTAKVDLPPFRQSAVDGYALCLDAAALTTQDHISASYTFELVDEIRAGQPQHTVLQAGQAQRIFTGAAVPQACVTVARQEIVNKISATQIQLQTDLKLNADTREQAEEIAQGQLLALAGQQLTVGAIAALCMAGVQQVKVYARPRVAVVITGDEVAQHSEAAQGSIIFDANGPMLMAWLSAQGIDAELHHVSDQAEALENCFAQLKTRVNVILSTGGVSVGDYDLVRPCAFAQGFKQVFWKVKQKPGKPLFFAKIDNSDKPCYLLGLPGNPAAVYVGLQVYAQTLLHVLQGQSGTLNWFRGKLEYALKPDSRERFLRMSAHVKEGTIYLGLLDNQQSHMLSNLMQANCLVRVPEKMPIEKGTNLSALWL